MATGPVPNQGKGKFLRVFLASNRDAQVEDVTAAWKAEGHDDGISESLVSKIRSELGLTGKRGSNGRATEDPGFARTKGKAKPQEAKGKVKKAEETTARPNIQEDDKGPSKSAFVGEVLGREPGANLSKVNEAWASAGHPGAISPSIYYKIKRERGGTGETEPSNSTSEPFTSGPKSTPDSPKPEMAKSPVEAASPPAQREPATSHPTRTSPDRADGHGRELHQIEGEIDELMFRLKGLGSFAEVQEALRAARRLLVRSHQH